jgi:transposase
MPRRRTGGLRGKRVVAEGGRLGLEVEPAAGAGCRPDCGRASVDVKDRPVVRVRDLPIAGRVTYLVWRKRRYRCWSAGGRSANPTPRASGSRGASAGACDAVRTVERSQVVEHLGGGPLGGEQRALHLPVPDGRGLGAGPVDAAVWQAN